MATEELTSTCRSSSRPPRPSGERRRGSSACCRESASRFFVPATPAWRPSTWSSAPSSLGSRDATTYGPCSGARFLNRDPLSSITRSPYSYGENNPVNNTDPLGLFCVGDLCTDGITDAIDDSWDSTGGRAVSWVADNPGTAATIVGVGVCIVGSLGACGAAAAGAWAVRSGERVVEDGFRDSFGVNLADGLITYATFGLVSAPTSYGIARGGTQAIPGVLAAGEQGIMAGSPFWLQGLVRVFSVTPDLAGLFGGWYFDDAC